MKLEKNHEDSIAAQAISKLEVLDKVKPLQMQKPDRLILGIISYNLLLQQVIDDESDQDDSNEFEKQQASNDSKVISALETGYESVKKKNFKETISRFEDLEKQGLSEGKFFKGMTMIVQNPKDYFTGLREMVEATLETLNEYFMESLQKMLEAGEKVKIFPKAKKIKYNVNQEVLGNFLRSLLDSGRDSHDEITGAALLLEALRQYYR